MDDKHFCVSGSNFNDDDDSSDEQQLCLSGNTSFKKANMF